MTPNPLDPEDGPHRPDPADLPEGIEAGDLPRLPMTVRKRRPPPEGDIEVFGVDEQDAEPVALQRWVDLASNVLRNSGVRGEAELSLLFVTEEVIDELNGRFTSAAGTNIRSAS